MIHDSQLRASQGAMIAIGGAVDPEMHRHRTFTVLSDSSSS